MTIRSFMSAIAAFALVAAGLVPLGYFVSVEVGVVQASPEDSALVGIGSTLEDRYIENLAFGVGEKLTFDINYGFINAGTATMAVERLIEYQGRPCYLLETRAESNSFFSTFYRVEDRVESIVDARGVFSWRFEKNLREGGYRADRTYLFDQIANTVVYEGDTIEVPPFVHDPISVLYAVRTQDLEVGRSIFIDNFTDGENYALEVRVIKKETLTVEAGTFDCVVVEPLLRSVGIFKHEGRLTVWLTDDRLKMPVLMKSKIIVGSITAELTDYELGEIDVF